MKCRRREPCGKDRGCYARPCAGLWDRDLAILLEEGRLILEASPDSGVLRFREQSNGLLLPELLIEALAQLVATAIGQHVALVEVVGRTLPEPPSADPHGRQAVAKQAGNMLRAAAPELLEAALAVGIEGMDLHPLERAVFNTLRGQGHARLDHRAPAVERGIEVGVDEKEHTTVAHELLNVASQWFRLPQDGELASDSKLCVRLVYIRFEHDVGMTAGVSSRQNRMEGLPLDLAISGVSNPALVLWL